MAREGESMGGDPEVVFCLSFTSDPLQAGSLLGRLQRQDEGTNRVLVRDAGQSLSSFSFPSGLLPLPVGLSYKTSCDNK